MPCRLSPSRTPNVRRDPPPTPSIRPCLTNGAAAYMEGVSGLFRGVVARGFVALLRGRNPWDPGVAGPTGPSPAALVQER